jgi:NAD(P)-dependent dehydrogenase (short-subunit alcohol dehydrogenase family)
VKSEVPEIEFLPVTVDISDEKQIADAFRQVVDKFSRIDYAINNAAIASPFVTTGDAEVQDFDRVQRINLKGTWLCEREELRQMMKQEPLLQTGESS